ncbi:MAG: ferrous iron transport protein B [Marinilabiliales bacterium]
MLLSELKNGEKGVIVKVKGHGSFRKRIMEMGFVKGHEVTVIKNAPLKDPIEYKLLNYNISLRRSEANLIEVVKADINTETKNKVVFNGTLKEETSQNKITDKTKVINIALVGNPNCGKTTLFNYLSKSNEHVGNYSGVTVDAKTAVIKYKDYTIKIVDLPGTYSLSAYSPEEIFVRKYIFSEMPDIVVNVIDSSNIDRNLFLTTQLIDMNIKVICALNMFDELKKQGDHFNYDKLGKMLGIPFVPTTAVKGIGVNNLLDKIIRVFEDNCDILRHIHINYGNVIEDCIKQIQSVIKKPENYFLTDKISSRFLAIKLLEKDSAASHSVSVCKNYREINDVVYNCIKKAESLLNEDIETYIADSRYGFISGALKETYTRNKKTDRMKSATVIDTFLTHKLFGFPIFIFLLWLMFYTTFNLGKYPVDWIESLVSFAGNSLNNLLPGGLLKDLLVDGIIGGVGGVIVFLPNILLLFLFIALMEDTGYMARAAFIMDKLMHKIGLHGKSFIPLIMGFGCNVPAIMSARIIENRSDRLLTILINPFMSCSARLPVYILLISAFFEKHATLVLFSIYMIGILFAIIMSIIFKKTLFKKSETPFVMELPPYRIPTIRNILRQMWFRSSLYLKKVGGIILFASIIIWALGYFPRETENTVLYESKIENINAKYDNQLAKAANDNVAKEILDKKTKELNSVIKDMKKDHQENSYIGKLGKFIEPVISPLGFDWKMGVSLIAGIAAKEVVVSTLGVLYMTEDANENNKQTLAEQMKKDTDSNGKNIFNPLVAFSFMLFILLYFPCIGVVSVIKKETGGWKWALFTVFYTTALAWIVSFTVYQIGSLFI